MYTATSELTVGARVKPSGYAIKPKRDYWLSCGRHEQKSAAKAALDAEIAKRGTITEVTKNGFAVQWDDGSQSRCLSYLVEAASNS